MDSLFFAENVKLAVVAHDAGGAEILSAWLAQAPVQRAQIFYVLAGPAEKIFTRKLGACPPTDLHSAILQADWIITGTGWQSMLEWQAIHHAQQQGKPVVAFLDHWVNYRERFIRDHILCLPDHIWVGDADAKHLAEKTFPNSVVVLHPNPYFLEVKQQFSHYPARPHGQNSHFLYVCEPIAEHAAKQFGNARHWGYTEFDALDYFLQQVPSLSNDVQQITIRPHPAEAPDKYSALMQRYDLPLKIGGGKDLIAEIAEADSVVGCNSMALVIAQLAAKKVYCCIPPSGPACSLPLREIVRL